MTEEQNIEYFQNLAINHKQINHSQEHQSFFYIEDIDELGEFDRALGGTDQNTVMLITASNGEFDDGGCNSYVEEIDGQLYILIKLTDDNSKRTINHLAKEILLSVLCRIRKDFPTKFRISKLPYQKVGPLNNVWYGYTVPLGFKCPFGFKVDSGTWSDKQ